MSAQLHFPFSTSDFAAKHKSIKIIIDRIRHPSRSPASGMSLQEMGGNTLDSHKHDVIVIGASAGGVEALTALTKDLPANLPAAIAVVLHLAPQIPGMLDSILSRLSLLPATQATHGMPFEEKHIYTPRPDHHLLIEDHRLRVIHGPKENRYRPSVDVLFRSAAVAYGPRVIGVILTGSLDDGTAGLLAIKRRGGLAVVQDPDDALYAGMPRSAIQHVNVDFCLPLAEIPALLTRLTSEPAEADEAYPVTEDMQREVRIAAMDMQALDEAKTVGNPSIYSCPECGGVLWELQDGELLRFRCRTGHAFSIQALLTEQQDAIEAALWVALKVLEERVSIVRRLSEGAEDRGNSALAATYINKIRDIEDHTAVIRRVLFAGEE